MPLLIIIDDDWTPSPEPNGTASDANTPPDVSAKNTPALVATVIEPDAVVVLDDGAISALQRLEALWRQHEPIACVIITGFQAMERALAAVRAGTVDYLGVRRVDPTAGLPPSEPHSIRRWARVVVAPISMPRDPRTLREWGRAVGVSVGGLRNWCRAAELSARRSLLFARVLRAVERRKWSAEAPQDLLNVVDRRTLSKLLAQAGGAGQAFPATTEEFLRHQTFIQNPRALNEVRVLLRSAPYSRPGEIAV